SSLAPAGGPNKATINVIGVVDGAAATAGNLCPAGLPGPNGTKYYHLLTLAAFVVTGYGGSAFTGDAASWLTGKTCRDYFSGGGTPCLMGYFTTATTGGGGIDPNAPPTGVTVVQLSG